MSLIPKYNYDYYNDILSNYIFELGGKIEFILSFFKVIISDPKEVPKIENIVRIKVQEANKEEINRLLEQCNNKDSGVYHRIQRNCSLEESKIDLYKKLEAEYFS